MGTVVADARPLATLLLDESTAPIVHARLAHHRMHNEVVISSVSWCGVLCVGRAKLGTFGAARVDAILRSVPLRVLDADERLATFAAEAKARFDLGLGDAYAAGLAIALRAPLLTGDTDILPLAEHGLTLDWVGAECQTP